MKYKKKIAGCSYRKFQKNKDITIMRSRDEYDYWDKENFAHYALVMYGTVMIKSSVTLIEWPIHIR